MADPFVVFPFDSTVPLEIGNRQEPTGWKSVYRWYTEMLDRVVEKFSNFSLYARFKDGILIQPFDFVSFEFASHGFPSILRLVTRDV